MYLLDTNIISDIAKNPGGTAAARFASTEAGQLCTSIIVSAEGKYGLEKARGHRLKSAMLAVLDAIEIVNLEKPADEIYAFLRAEMAQKGKAITPNDMFIAAHAMAIGATMVTDDEGFRQVPGLTVENWLRDVPAVRE